MILPFLFQDQELHHWISFCSLNCFHSTHTPFWTFPLLFCLFTSSKTTPHFFFRSQVFSSVPTLHIYIYIYIYMKYGMWGRQVVLGFFSIWESILGVFRRVYIPCVVFCVLWLKKHLKEEKKKWEDWLIFHHEW